VYAFPKLGQTCRIPSSRY